MQKITLLLASILLRALLAFGQPLPTDSSYQSRRLSVEEVSLMTSYYQQDGNQSAVTGGRGTEQLTDISNQLSFTLRLARPDGPTQRLAFTQGVDVYTSASSDRIDTVQSSPSRLDVRTYPQLNWSLTNAQETQGLRANASFSTEYDYRSWGAGVGYWRTAADQNQRFDADVQVFLDSWAYILPLELRPPGYGSGGEDDPLPIERRARRSASLSLAYQRVITPRLQVSVMADPGWQQGLLSTPFHRVFDETGQVLTEELPDQRFRLPLGIRAHAFLGRRAILRLHYRYYWDTWGVQAHTVQLELPLKLGAQWSVSPYLRLHTQSAARYYEPYATHPEGSELRTSDADLSALNSAMAGLHLRYRAIDGFFDLTDWNLIELRLGAYGQSRGLDAQIVTLRTGYAF